MNEQVEEYTKRVWPQEYDTIIAAFTDVLWYLDKVGENELAERVWSQKELLKSRYNKNRER